MEESHPIPQDITGFQFKLIGDMTVKQFAYLAFFAIIAWVMYLSPIPTLIKIPLAIALFGCGIALAFVPVDGRPMDAMIMQFFKAVFSPTQYVYQKQGVVLAPAGNGNNDLTKTLTQDQLKNFLNKLPKGKLDKKEMVFFQNVATQSNQTANVTPKEIPSHYYATQAPANPAPATLPKSAPTSASSNAYTESLQKTAAVLQKELDQAKQFEEKQKLNQIDPKAYLETHQKVLELQNQLTDMAAQKQELEKKLIEFQKQSFNTKAPVFAPSMAQAPQTTQNVRVVPHSMARSVGIAEAPEFPNLLTGIIKDSRGNPLQNILVEVKDAEGNAVRAFKTNALGQFASATALTNGKYTIEFDDPKAQQKFDTVAFEANGQVIMPIEVISTDQREELRKQLFSN